MKKKYVETLPVSTIRRGLVDETTSLVYKTWEAGKGRLTKEFLPILPRLVQFDAAYQGCDVPDIIFVGRESLSAKVFGPSMLSEVPTTDMIDAEFRQFVAGAYHSAIDQDTPTLDMISSPLMLPTCDMVWVRYTRLVLPISLNHGSRLLLTHCEPIDLTWKRAHSSFGDPLLYSPRATGPLVSRMEASTNSELSPP